MTRATAALNDWTAVDYGEVPPSSGVSTNVWVRDGDDLILGRSAERADLVIPDSSVSREHLRLLTVGSTVTLLDLGSRNGVLVNGRRVDGSVTLRDGDVVTVGQTELLFFGGTGGRA